MVGLMASSQAESTMASWVSTEYAAAGCAAGSRTRSSAKIEVAALLKPLRPFPIKRFKPDARRRFPDIGSKDGLASSLYLQYPESLRRDSFRGAPPGRQEFHLEMLCSRYGYPHGYGCTITVHMADRWPGKGAS